MGPFAPLIIVLQIKYDLIQWQLNISSPRQLCQKVCALSADTGLSLAQLCIQVIEKEISSS